MNILLPTDFSENSRNAAVYAMQFFRDIPCTFHFLHVLPVPEKLATGHMAIPSEIQQNFKILLDGLTGIKVNPEHIFSTTVKSNYLIEAVRQQVLEKNINLILMGTKGSSNKKGAAIGKNTSDVMIKVKCPVLAISENAVYKEHKEILFPTDYKIQHNTRMLNTLLNLSSLSRAEVKILELFNTDKEPSDEQIANRLFLQSTLSPKVPALQTYYSSKKGDAGQLIMDNSNVDMIVMVAKNLNICQKLLRNHQNNQIPFLNQLPLLVLHG